MRMLPEALGTLGDRPLLAVVGSGLGDLAEQLDLAVQGCCLISPRRSSTNLTITLSTFNGAMKPPKK